MASKTADLEYRNISLEQLRDKIRAGDATGDDLAGYLDEDLVPINQLPLLSISLPQAKIKREEHSKSLKKISSGNGGNSNLIKKLLFAVAGISAFVVIAFVLQTLIFSEKENTNNPFLRALDEWRLEYPTISGNAEKFLIDGLRYQDNDTSLGYKKADASFKKALILSPHSLKAIGAYVENYAHLPEIKVKAYPLNIQLAKEGIEFALEIEPKNPSLVHAKASLLSALGENDTAQKLLLLFQKRVPSAQNHPDILFLLAQTVLNSAPQDSINYIDRIRNTYKKKNILTLEAAAKRRLGDFNGALELLNKRLEDNPGNSEALFEFVHLKLDLSDGQNAIKPLEKLIQTDGQNVSARLLKAIIHYQINEDTTKAQAELEFIEKQLKGISGSLYVRVLSHLSYIHLINNRVEMALDYSSRAIKEDPTSLSAVYIHSLALFRNKKFPAAISVLEKLNRHILSSKYSFHQALILTQLAKAELASSKQKKAIEHFTEAIQSNSEYLPAYLGLAAAHMSVDESRQAATVIRRSLDIDPLHRVKFKELTDFPEDPNDLKKFLSIYKVSTSSKIGYALKLSAQGVLEFQTQNNEKAYKTLQNAIVLDKHSHIALLYSAVIQIAKNNYPSAHRYLKKAVKTTARTHLMTRTYLAYTELKIGKIKSAEDRITKILDNDSSHVFARQTMAQLLVLKAKKNISSEEHIDEAKKILRGILKEYPNYSPAKKLLGQI